MCFNHHVSVPIKEGSLCPCFLLSLHRYQEFNPSEDINKNYRNQSHDTPIDLDSPFLIFTEIDDLPIRYYTCFI